MSVSKEQLLEKIAKSEDWRAAAWLVERLEKQPDEGEDGVDELASKRAKRRKSA